MIGQDDLFGFVAPPAKPNYPERAGYTEPTTSKEAADKIEASGRAATLREEVADWFRAGNTGTVHEIAAIFGEPVPSIQPRISELRKQGLIEPSGVRRKNGTGSSAHVWRKAVPSAI